LQQVTDHLEYGFSWRIAEQCHEQGHSSLQNHPLTVATHQSAPELHIRGISESNLGLQTG